MTGKCRAYLWVPLKRMSCTLSWMQMFPSPFNAFFTFYLIVFSFKRIVGGHCPGVVTQGCWERGAGARAGARAGAGSAYFQKSPGAGAFRERFLYNT
jgi:hypothetical protein